MISWEIIVPKINNLKYELIHVEEDKIYITTDWSLNPSYKFIIDNIKVEDDTWVFIRILSNIVEDLSKMFNVNITRISKISADEPERLPYGYLKPRKGKHKKLGSKRIVLGQKINGFVWKEIAFVENFKKRSPGCSGGGGFIWKWDYDKELIDYEEIIPDIVRRKVSLNSFRKSYI